MARQEIRTGPGWGGLGQILLSMGLQRKENTEKARDEKLRQLTLELERQQQEEQRRQFDLQLALNQDEMAQRQTQAGATAQRLGKEQTFQQRQYAEAPGRREAEIRLQQQPGQEEFEWRKSIYRSPEELAETQRKIDLKNLQDTLRMMGINLGQGQGAPAPQYPTPGIGAGIAAGVGTLRTGAGPMQGITGQGGAGQFQPTGLTVQLPGGGGLSLVNPAAEEAEYQRKETYAERAKAKQKPEEIKAEEADAVKVFANAFSNPDIITAINIANGYMDLIKGDIPPESLKKLQKHILTVYARPYIKAVLATPKQGLEKANLIAQWKKLVGGASTPGFAEAVERERPKKSGYQVKRERLQDLLQKMTMPGPGQLGALWEYAHKKGE